MTLPNFSFNPTPIERDITTHAHKRLETWIEDTLMRCEVMDIPARNIPAILLAPIFEIGIRVLTRSAPRSTREDFLIFMGAVYDDFIKLNPRSAEPTAK